MSKLIATNRKAYRDYEIIESFEAGIELRGSEVKSLRDGRINFEDGFARVDNNEVILYNVHISPYAFSSYLNVDSVRQRKLLLHRPQIDRLAAQLSQKGLTLVPLKVYFTEKGIAKIELALCKGKKLYDKRADIKKREVDMKLRKDINNRRK